MAKRVALTALLPSANAALEPQAATRTQESGSRPVPPRLVEAAPQHETASPREPSGEAEEWPGAPDVGHQHFSQLVRKETRLRDDQLDALAAHARRLSRAKAAGTARITDNTLVRIAIDLLLEDAERLHGSTEAELRKSVGL